jgi:lipopolysaccharide/colanic/teichoic acid biosynthesis glycosyltransferase
MSFVGPRPRSVPEYKELLQKYPEAEIITSLRPGIGSWYGIKNGSYKNEDLIYRELTRDLYYTRKHHLGIDMQIIAKLALNSIKLK